MTTNVMKFEYFAFAFISDHLQKKYKITFKQMIYKFNMHLSKYKIYNSIKYN